jgi:hypothetical protein
MTAEVTKQRLLAQRINERDRGDAMLCLHRPPKGALQATAVRPDLCRRPSSEGHE